MKISFNSLKQYIDFNENPEELGKKLTSIGFEVSLIKEVNKVPSGLMVGKIISIEKHLNADKLQIAKVETKNDNYQIICGASNIKKNQYVMIALEGTKLSENFKIEKKKIRGIESHGMICSEEELGLEDKSDGIWILEKNTNLEDHPQKHFGDIDFILEIEIPSNRIDCFSTIGIAREIEIFTEKKFFFKEQDYSPKLSNINIQIENRDKCYRYSTKVIGKITITSSPTWLKRKLYHLGIRSINNIVDITNYIMLDYGQPMHAFDLDKIQGKQIKVRLAKKNEKLKILTGETITLTEDDLVIADEKKTIALAGIIGGLESSVHSTTYSILLESAHFEKKNIKKSSKYHKLKTEASLRFEKAIDIEMTFKALEAAVKLILKTVPGSMSEGINDVYFKKNKEKTILFPINEIKKKLSIDLTKQQILDYFYQLGFKPIYSDNEKIKLKIPKHRFDIQHEWDLIEEIARIYGYDNLPEIMPAFSNSSLSISDQRQPLYHQLAQSLGYHQMINFSFLEKKYIQSLNFSKEKHILLSNPISPEFAYLRKDMVFGLLKNIQFNLERKNSLFNKIYEYGNVFSKEKNQFLEKKTIGFLGHQNIEETNWINKERKFDFYDLKGDIEQLIKKLVSKSPTFKKIKNALFIQEASAGIFVKDQQIGQIGIILNDLLKYFNIKESKAIFYADINISLLEKIGTHTHNYQKTSIYPSIYRDLAIIVEKNIAINNIINLIKSTHSFIKRISLTDIYSGDKIKENKQSIVFNIEICSDKKTLQKNEADSIINQVVKQLEKKLILN